MPLRTKTPTGSTERVRQHRANKKREHAEASAARIRDLLRQQKSASTQRPNDDDPELDGDVSEELEKDA
jgi:hypothetical protein